MTFHELYDSEHPDTPLNSFMVVPCPHKYGYEEKNPEMCRKMIDCKACWERDVPEKPHSYAEAIAETILAFKNKHNDPVNHPAHYTSGGIECIDAIEAATDGLVGFEAVCTAQVIKYIWRWKWKNGAEDLKKAKWYLDRLIAKAKQ